MNSVTKNKDIKTISPSTDAKIYCTLIISTYFLKLI